MGAPSIVFWFKDFQFTQNAGGALPDRFQNGHRYTSLVGLATSVGSSVPNGASGCWQPFLDIRSECSMTLFLNRRAVSGSSRHWPRTAAVCRKKTLLQCTAVISGDAKQILRGYGKKFSCDSLQRRPFRKHGKRTRHRPQTGAKIVPDAARGPAGVCR
jgi:hypothetical protein